MGKFSKIKKYNLDSLSIDEKIKFLDKEMEKTGLNEVATNSTSGVYQQARTDENDKYANFIACSHNGKSFGISSPNGSAGGAVIEIDDPTLPGVAKSPPHPVTGDRVTAQTHAGFGSFEPTRPGYRRSPSHRMHGSVVWYWNPSGGGGSGSYNSLEYTSPDPHGSNVYTGIEGALYQAGYGYWGSNFIGMPMLRSDGLDANLTDCIRSFDETSGQPDTVVLFTKNLDDPSFMPPKIPGMSDEAFRALLRRLGYDPDSPDPDDPDKTEFKKGEKGEMEEEEEDGPLVHGMTQEEVKRKYGNYDDDQLGRLHIKRLPDGSYREMTQAEIDAFNKYYGKKVLGDLAYKAGLAYRNVHFIFDKIMPLGKSIDQILKGDSGYDKLDAMVEPIIEKIGKYAGRKIAKGKYETSANVMFRYDKWLAGGAKGRVDVTNEVSSKDMKTLRNELINPGGNTPEKWVKSFMNRPKNMPDYAATEEEAWNILAQDVQDRLDTQMRKEGTGLSMTFHNNVQLDRAKYIASRGKVIEATKTYKFSEKTGSTKVFSDKVLGRLLGGLGIEMDRFGTGGLQNSIISLLGAKYGLAAVNRDYGGKADRAPGMPMKIRISAGISESIGSFDAYMKSTNFLSEDVKLGHFDPEALTVDIEDIRKGILPEFPKDPPPEMIDGHSKKSKLAPKQLPKDPFIKITKKDLAKNHKLKDSEIKEFMRQIDAVNEYIQKHPEELIYVQQRYPVNDKRLAALNFKMDQMLEAGEEYLDTQFPENQRLVDRLKKATKKTMELTNPEAYKGLKKPDMELMSLDDHMKEKRVVSHHFKKKRQSNSMFRVDMEKVKEKNRKVAEHKVAEWQEKRRIELLNSNEFDELKCDWRKELGEGMTTQMLTGILPSTGDADLETLQTGLTGAGDIDYGEAGLGDEVMAGEGEYTCFTNFDDLDNVRTRPEYNTGTRLRLFDQETKQFRSGLVGGGAHGYLQAIPGFKSGSMRNVKPSGDYNASEKSRRERLGLPILQGGSNLYYHLYGPTNDVLGLGYGTWNSNDGVTAARTGTRLDFNGPGSPRYAALKEIDSTGFDTIKIHALLGDDDIVNTYRDSEHLGGTLRDKRVQIYYWAGDKDDYVRHPSASTTYQGHNNTYVSGDGWRPINMKPNGEIDPDVDPYIIKHTADRPSTAIDANGIPYSTDNKLAPYSLPIPDYARDKHARYMIVQVDKTNIPTDAFSVLSVRFQRRSNVKTPALTKPLTDIETSPFVRVGPTKKNEGGKERKKKVKDIIDGGLKYTETKFSKDFPVRTTLESKLFDKLKDRKIIKEGMTTQVLTGILPSAGNTDLDTMQLGATGSDLSYVDGADAPVDGEFTALVNTDPITSVDDPLSVGTNIRSPQNGASLSLDFTDSDAFHTHTDPGDSVPGDDGGTRGSGISGNYNSGYVNDEGATNENIPFNDFNGEYLPARVGTHLGFGNNTRLANAGFPRYAALKAVDTTEFDTLSMNWFCRGTVNTDTVDGSPTQGEKVVGGSTTKFNTAGDGVSVFYWAGDKEGAATYAPSVTGQSGIHDGWRPINVKPDGTTDNSYSPWLITHKADVATYGSGSRQKHDSGYPAEVLLNNKITLPPWCRDKNTRFLLHQGRNAAGAGRANFGITSVRFQRRSTMKVRSLMKPLSDVESSPFVRVGPTKKNVGGKERKKKVQDIIRSGLKYTGKKFSKDFPVRTDLE